MINPKENLNFVFFLNSRWDLRSSPNVHRRDSGDLDPRVSGRLLPAVPDRGHPLHIRGGRLDALEGAVHRICRLSSLARCCILVSLRLSGSRLQLSNSVIHPIYERVL